MKLDREIGVAELARKLDIKSLPAMHNDPRGILNRYSICADYCHGTGSVTIARKYLDSGVLSQMVEKTMANLPSDRNGSIYLLTILAAGAMSLGCTITAELKSFLEKNPSTVIPMRAKWQVKKALADYENGTPYNFGNRTMYEAQLVMIRGDAAKIETVNNGWQKHIKRFKNANDKEGSVDQIIGPPGPGDLGEKKVQSFEVCGDCGFGEAKAGGALVVCGNCKDRKYCSRACQKKHWKQHKMVCKTVTSELKDELLAAFHAESGAKIEDIQVPKSVPNTGIHGISMMLS